MNDTEYNPGDHFDPNSEAEAAYQIAVQYFDERQYDQALTAAADAIRLNPDYLEPYRLRLHIHKLRDDHQGAITELDQILRILPNDSWTYHQRAKVRLDMKQAAEALADANLAIQHNPYLAKDAKNFSPHDSMALNTGTTWQEESPYENTVEEDLAILYLTRSIALDRLGRREEARADMRQYFLLRLDLDEIDKWDERELVHRLTRGGRKLLEDDNYPEAIEACSAALAVTPDNCEARAVRGIAYHLTGQHAKASADLVKAWQLKEQQDLTVRCRLVSTDYIRPEAVLGVFPDTPDGRHKATALAEAVARDEKLRAELLGEEAKTIDRTFVFEVEGKNIDLIDYVWVDGEDENDDQAPHPSAAPPS